MDCPEGSFMDLEGQQVCKACPPGRFGNDTALGECIRCLAGFAELEENRTECTPCPPGEFAAVRGQVRLPVVSAPIMTCCAADLLHLSAGFCVQRNQRYQLRGLQ